MKPILELHHLAKHFDGLIALDDVSVVVEAGDTVGVFGPNGAGKTTLFNVMTGFVHADRGTVTYRGKHLLGMMPYAIANLGVARTFQELRMVGHLTALDNVLLCFKNQLGEDVLRALVPNRSCRRQEKKNTEHALSLLRLTSMEDKAGDLAAHLSYGQQRLLSLACCMATGAEVFLLDEPVSGVAPEMIDKILAIIRTLPAQGKSVVIIEHNVDALRQVCSRLIFMDAGKKVCEGLPDQVLNDSRVIDAYLG